ncbi:MAG: glycerophosphodiester phosphodiesterase [Promethearchaeia archaeon]
MKTKSNTDIEQFFEDKPYIFAHRGAMGYEVENTMESFKKALDMRVGIETDVRLTKDKKLVCFHDKSFKINERWHSVKRSTLKELRGYNFKDDRYIPTIKEVFEEFQYCSILRYSIDISNSRAGKRLIDIAKEFNILNRIEITDTRLRVLEKLRNYDNKVKLVHTVPPIVQKVKDDNVEFQKLKDLSIDTLNIQYIRADEENFELIVDHGFHCYVWGVNRSVWMKRILKLRHHGEFVRALYSNYPDKLKRLRKECFG